MRILKYFGIFFCIFTVLAVIYMPIWKMDYAFLDDYRFFETLPHQFKLHSLYPINIPIGRFVGVIIATFLGWMVNSISDLTTIRIINIGMTSFCALILMQGYARILSNSLQGFLCAVIICTLPPFQSTIPCAGHSFNLAAALFASSSVAVIHFPNTARFLSKTRIIASVFLMFLALSTHQSIAMFFWVVTACFLTAIWLHNRTLFNTYLRLSLGVGIGSMILYFVTLQIMKIHYGHEPLGMYNPYLLSHGYFRKLVWFLTEPLINSLNLWNIFPKLSIALTIGIFIITTGVLYSFRVLRRASGTEEIYRTLRKLCTICLVCFVFIFLCFLPNFLSIGDAPWYRCCMGLTPFIMMILILCIREWLTIFSISLRTIIMVIILLIGSIIGGRLANETVLCQRVLPSYAEFTYIKNILQQTGLGNINQIHIIRPTTPLILTRYDEFGALTMDNANSGIGPMMVCIVREVALANRLETIDLVLDKQNVIFNFLFKSMDKRNEYYNYSVKVTSTFEGEAFVQNKSTLLIDMTKLREIFNDFTALGFKITSNNLTNLSRN